MDNLFLIFVTICRLLLGEVASFELTIKPVGGKMARAHLSDSEIDAWRCVVGPYVEDIKMKLENNVNGNLNFYLQEMMNIPVVYFEDKDVNDRGTFRYLSKGVMN